MKSYYYISLVPAEEQKEIVLGICYSLGMLGCEEEEEKDGVLLKCYFQDRKTASKAKKHLKKIVPSAQIKISQIENQDWNENWHRKIKPVKVTENIWVSPKWLKPKLQESDYWIKIEPKMAFGTGHHETTRLAAKALLKVDISEKTTPKLLDVGSGSGILCFIGDYAGYSQSTGIEIDMDCMGSIVENRMTNEVKGRVSFIVGTIDGIKEEEIFHTIVMNMILVDSEPLLEKCRALLIPDGNLIWSGLLFKERDSVVDYADLKGWDLVSEIRENEWWCGVFKKNC